ncbi:MAG TPA: acyltransferase [Opitutaceae bacterium]|nr:acyltransferase [Opitutaceae bacterium]
MSSSRNFGLDLIRCIAIGLVVFSHGMYFIYPFVPELPLGGGNALHLYHLGHAGAMGVELFFVLSGFLIGGLLLRLGDRLGRGRELLRFYIRRWFRTLPNYYVFLALNVALWGALRYLPPFLLFLQNLTANHVTFFPESWSLGVEEWFYVVFPLLTWLFLQLRFRFDAAFLTAGGLLYGLSTVLRFFYAANPGNDWAGGMRIITVLHFDGLMTGIFAAWLSLRHPRAFNAFPRACAVMGIALFLFCYATIFWHGAHNETLFARTVRFNLISLGMVLVFPWAVRGARYSGILARPVEHLARWSYAMYFLNLPLFHLVSERLFPRSQSSALQGWLAFFILEGGVILAAAFWYTVFERPTTALRDRFCAASGSS